MGLKRCPCGMQKCYIHPTGKTVGRFYDINGNKYPEEVEYISDCGKSWLLNIGRNVWCEGSISSS